MGSGSAKRIGLILLSLLLLTGSTAVFILHRALEDPPYDELAKETLPGTELADRNPSRSLLHFHTFLDWAVISLGRFSTRDRAYFREGVETRDFEEHLKAVRLEIPATLHEGLYELEARTLEGPMDPAFRVLHWYSPSAPTIIYNHGASQYPYDGIFAGIFPAEITKRPLKVNLIVIRTPFHRHGRTELNDGASTLSRYLSILAVSVRLTEGLVQAVRAKGSSVVEVAGVSQGGFIANLHHLRYDSATFYVPIVSGTAFDDVFLETSKADPSALRDSGPIRRNLRLTEEWKRRDNRNVFPVLARYDYVCRLEHQGPAYGAIPVEVWERGHITAALSFRALRHVLLRHISKSETDPPRTAPDRATP